MFNWEELITPLATLGSGAIIALVTAYFKWQSHRFHALEDLARRVETTTHQWLDTHELMDQKRHEENLYRFEKISVSLARLGSTNGTSEH